jgi:hypothetical protein
MKSRYMIHISRETDNSIINRMQQESKSKEKVNLSMIGESIVDPHKMQYAHGQQQEQNANLIDRH